ncbi:hypothetical protein ACIQ1D_19185 [Lysinibacillus xylanilyticus]|uniref:hypothetical protein n=1 Tax=Lysinibacillus xylanilyticus TaxID=582475 RepID=UPI0038245A97
MFKIKSDYQDHWVITLESTGLEVAVIKVYEGFRIRTKQLYVKDKKISDIRNQKEALEKLEEFFKTNALSINAMQAQIDELEQVCESLVSPLAIGILGDFATNLKVGIEHLSKYQLVDINLELEG